MASVVLREVNSRIDLRSDTGLVNQNQAYNIQSSHRCSLLHYTGRLVVQPPHLTHQVSWNADEL